MPLSFPTELHQQAAESIAGYLSTAPEVDTILVINSCARGKATPESDLDMGALTVEGTSWDDVARLKQNWRQAVGNLPPVQEFKQSGRNAYVHLPVSNGEFVPRVWDEGGGPDNFEISIGNWLAHSAPFSNSGPHFAKLQSKWLPYYDDDLRSQRLAMVRDACLADLDYLSLYLGRGLYFQAFDRLYKAFQEFLQAMFIAHRCYPIAYNKWIHEQVVEWLGLADLYPQLAPIISVHNLESRELEEHAQALHNLLDQWT